MPQQKKIHNLTGRLTMVLILALGGFVFPLLFFIAAFIAWSLIEDWRSPSLSPETIPPLFRATAQTPDWEQLFFDLCESPAERAFLQAMMRAHNLAPDNGQLHSTTLTLALQVKIPPYRVDFLINDKLIVEIDGATYHSSSEAVARDRQRDEYLGAKGYVTLRVPAKVVFDTPEIAVKQVNSAWMRLSESSCPTTAASPLGQVTIGAAVGVKSMATKISEALMVFSSSLNERQRVAEALRVPREAFETEKLHIDGALKLARQRTELEDWLSGEAGRRELFQQTLDSLRARVAAINDTETPTPINEKIAPFSAPLFGLSGQLDQAIESAFRQLTNIRSEYFTQIRLQLQENAILRETVRKVLSEFGQEGCWQNIAPVISQKRIFQADTDSIAKPID